MKKIIASVLLLLLIFCSLPISVLADEPGNGYLPETITTVEQLLVWVDYLCVEGRYGHNNDINDVTSLDCMGTANLIYSKMGKGINWNNITSTGKKITKLSDAKIGDLVVYVNPNPDSQYFGEVSHVAIYLGDGELFQASSAKDNMVTETRINKKSWSNIKKFKCKWTGEYKDWYWGEGNLSEHPENIFIIHVVDLKSDPSSVDGMSIIKAYID